MRYSTCTASIYKLMPASARNAFWIMQGGTLGGSAEGLQGQRLTMQMGSLSLVILSIWSTLQVGSVCRFERTADEYRSGSTPPVPNRFPEGLVAEARIYGQRVAGTGPGCHRLHEEAGATQVGTPQVTFPLTVWTLVDSLSPTVVAPAR